MFDRISMFQTIGGAFIYWIENIPSFVNCVSLTNVKYVENQSLFEIGQCKDSKFGKISYLIHQYILNSWECLTRSSFVFDFIAHLAEIMEKKHESS